MAKRAGLAMLIVAALAISFDGFFYFRDNFSTHFPLKAVSSAAYRHGAIPFWNPSAGGGQPLAGNPNALTFYPDNILYLFLPVQAAFNLHFLLHLAVAFAAMRALCRETGSGGAAASLAALFYVSSGLAVSATAFYNLIVAVALLPLAFCCAERLALRASWTNALALGATCGLLGLAGEPVTVAGAAGGIAIIFLARRRPDGLARPAGDVESPAITAIPSPTTRLALFVCVALATAIVVASPQIIAFSEIAHEVERSAHPFSARSVLAASLPVQRLAEILIGPFRGLITDRGPHAFHSSAGEFPPLFSSLFIGGAVIPAIFRRSGLRRYRVVAAAMLFLALGASNPIVRAAVESSTLLRFGRYPEKLALPLVIAIFVLIGRWLTPARRTTTPGLVLCALPLPLLVFDLVRRTGDGSLDAITALIAAGIACALAANIFRDAADPRRTFLILFPLVYWGVRALPVDRYGPYADALTAANALSGHRVVVTGNEVLDVPTAISTRDEYRTRARLIHPLFGMAGGVRYALDRSPEGMYSFLSRVAHERFVAAPPSLASRYAALAGCEAIVSHGNASGRNYPTIVAVNAAVPDACFIGAATQARSVQDAVRILETPSFRPGVDAAIPTPGRRFGAGRVVSLKHAGDRIEVAVICDREALLRIGESYWTAWNAVAVAGAGSDVVLRTLPVDLDRLGVIVPPGSWTVTLTFGRHRQLVAAAWLVSTLALAAAAVAAWRSRNSSAAPAR